MILGFYDAIKENPHELLSELLKHIGADENIFSNKLRKIENKSISIQMPSKVRGILNEKYEPMLPELSSLYDGYATPWHLSLYGNGIKQTVGINRIHPVAHP